MNAYSDVGTRFGYDDLDPELRQERMQRSCALGDLIGNLITTTFYGLNLDDQPAQPEVFEERDPAIAESTRVAAAMRRCAFEGLNR